MGKLGPKNMMIMDILGTYAIHCSYNNYDDGSIRFTSRIPTERNMKVRSISHAYISHKILSYTVRLLPEYHDGRIPSYLYANNALPDSVDRIYKRIKKPLRITLRDSYLKDQIPFLGKYSSKELSELITNTGQCALEMTYPIRFYNGNKYDNFFFNNIGVPSTLYTLYDVKAVKTSKDGHILDRQYDIIFDTFLGFYFIQNSISCYTDLIPDKFYSLSDYAQLLYRLLILPYYKKVKNPLSLNEIRYRLDFKTKDTYMVRKVVRELLEELEAHSFIKEPKEIRIYKDYLYSFTRSTWKERVGLNDADSETDLVEPVN
ncbi:MAG: hypothetical protein BWY61_02087 [Firmicutes bacterium ADurb.Bin354]|nr:MAG: hypothetical protein BWY61_02087 [Firmicutes bacterium ADurb.Bin354]